LLILNVKQRSRASILILTGGNPWWAVGRIVIWKMGSTHPLEGIVHKSALYYQQLAAPVLTTVLNWIRSGAALEASRTALMTTC
jgi:hypothetical protein